MAATKLDSLDSKVRGNNPKESGIRLVESDEGVYKAESYLLKERTELYPEYRTIQGNKNRHIDKILGMSDIKVKTLTLRTLVDVKIKHLECVDFPNVTIHYENQGGERGAISLPLLDPKGPVKGVELSVFAAFESRCFNREKNDYSGKKGLQRCLENFLDVGKEKEIRHAEFEKISLYHSVFQGDKEVPELRSVPLLFSYKTIDSYFRYVKSLRGVALKEIVKEFKDLIGYEEDKKEEKDGN